MNYELWADTGLKYFKIDDSESLETLIHKANILQRNGTVEIRREDGCIYDFTKQTFYRKRGIADVERRQRNRNPIL